MLIHLLSVLGGLSVPCGIGYCLYLQDKYLLPHEKEGYVAPVTAPVKESAPAPVVQLASEQKQVAPVVKAYQPDRIAA